MPKNTWIMKARIAASIITGKRAMPNYVRQVIFSITGKKAQEIPGWAYIVGMIIGLVVLILLIWISVKSGKVGVQQIAELK